MKCRKNNNQNLKKSKGAFTPYYDNTNNCYVSEEYIINDILLDRVNNKANIWVEIVSERDLTSTINVDNLNDVSLDAKSYKNKSYDNERLILGLEKHGIRYIEVIDSIYDESVDEPPF